MTHGLTISSIIVDRECEADFLNLLARLEQTFEPQSERAYMLVRRLAVLLWRQRRAGLFEALSLERTGPMAAATITSGNATEGTIGDAVEEAEDLAGDAALSEDLDLADRHARGARLTSSLRNKDYLKLISRYERAGDREIATCLKELYDELEADAT